MFDSMFLAVANDINHTVMQQNSEIVSIIGKDATGESPIEKPYTSPAQNYLVFGDDQTIIEPPINTHDFFTALYGTEVIGVPRFLYYNQNFEEKESSHGPSNTATAVGGLFGLQTGCWYGLCGRLVFYTSQKIPFLNPSNSAILSDKVFTTSGNSWSYIGEGALQYIDRHVHIEVGNFIFNSPYADTLDKFMAPNTFQGAYARFDYDNIIVQPFFFSRRAGDLSITSEKSAYEYKKMGANVNDDSFGAPGMEFKYTFFNENDFLDIWYYYGDAYAQMLYAELNHEFIETKHVDVDMGVHYSSFIQNRNSNIQGQYAGAMAELNSNAVHLALGFDYAWVDNQNYISEGYGGGPYYAADNYYDVSVVLMDIRSSLGNAYEGSNVWGSSLVAGLTWTFAGLESLYTQYNFGYFNPSKYDGLYYESDFRMNWYILDNALVTVMYSLITQHIKPKSVPYSYNNSNQRLWFRMQYAF